MTMVISAHLVRIRVRVRVRVGDRVLVLVLVLVWVRVWVRLGVGEARSAAHVMTRMTKTSMRKPKT